MGSLRRAGRPDLVFEREKGKFLYKGEGVSGKVCDRNHESEQPFISGDEIRLC